MRHLTLFCLVVACSICIAQQDTINIDLGNTGLSSPLPWNNVTNTNIGAASDLFTQAGFTTGMEIVVTDTFNGINSTGNVPVLHPRCPNGQGAYSTLR